MSALNMQELYQEREKIIVKQDEISEKMKTEKRFAMTPEEQTAWNKMDEDIDKIEKTIEKMEKFQNRYNSLDDSHTQTDWGNPEPGNGRQPGSRMQVPEMSLGEICIAAAVAGGARDKIRNMDVSSLLDRANKVQNAATGSSANVPADGGFFIGTERSREIMKLIHDGGQIIKNCTTFEIGKGNDSLEIPYLEETSRATGSRFGGIQVYRKGETEAPTNKEPDFGMWECRLEDLKAHVYITDRLLNNATGLESVIRECMPQEFTFKVEDEIFNGKGGAQCKAIIGDNSSVTISKETGQEADTVVFENILKMYSRMWGRSRPNAAWYYNQDVEPQLFSLCLNVGTGGVPVFMPASGINGSPYSTLFGRPLIPVEQASTLGDLGDIIFADMSQYALVQQGGLKEASSIHVRFLYDEMVFKFNMRINGRPKLKSAITPYKGTNTLAPFVMIEARA